VFSIHRFAIECLWLARDRIFMVRARRSIEPGSGVCMCAKEDGRVDGGWVGVFCARALASVCMGVCVCGLCIGTSVCAHVESV
jgi:hypothetical protein